MYDKTVRRRRAVLGLLVACSLILLTAYFGESAGGGLHSVQRGVVEVVSPIQEGASRALKPVRDLFGWVGDTVNAKGKVDGLEKERDQLRTEVVGRDAALRENQQFREMLALDTNASLKDNGPVTARVIGQSPTLWYATIAINKGSNDGLAVDQPVITGAGLVGKVKTVTPGTAIVALITDHTVAVSARINESGIPGLLSPEIGKPRDLVMRYTTRNDPVDPGQRVVTSGTDSRAASTPSLFPPGIPIGRVTKVDDAGTDNQVVHLKPFADMTRLEFVQVLTKRQDDNRK